jgi:hypothetical protein
MVTATEVSNRRQVGSVVSQGTFAHIPKWALELLNKGHEFASAQFRAGIVFSSCREHSWLFRIP